MRSFSLVLFVLLALPNHIEAQCSVRPSVSAAPVPEVPLPEPASAIVARGAAIEALPEHDPSRSQALLELATAYRAMGDVESAIRILAGLVLDHPDGPWSDRVLLDLGRDLTTFGRRSDARGVFARLARRHPSSPWVAAAEVNLGDYFYDGSNFVAAVGAYERAVHSAGPMLAYAQYRLAWARAQLRLPSATATLAQALAALATPGVSATPELDRAIRIEGPAITVLAGCPRTP